MPQKELDRFSVQVVEIMPLLVREFARREDNELTRGKISCPQMVALDYASHHKRVRMSDIAKVLATRNSSASVLVDRLIRAGMLRRERDAEDRRVVWVNITARGRRVLDQIILQKQRSIREVFSPLKPEERSQYLRILHKLRDHFEGPL